MMKMVENGYWPNYASMELQNLQKRPKRYNRIIYDYIDYIANWTDQDDGMTI